MAITVENKGKKMIITADLEVPGVPSQSGKTLVVASTHGNVATGVQIDGKELKLGLNAYKALLLEANPLIVKDFMDRVAGKPTQPVEHAVTESLADLLAMARAPAVKP